MKKKERGALCSPFFLRIRYLEFRLEFRQVYNDFFGRLNSSRI